ARTGCLVAVGTADEDAADDAVAGRVDRAVEQIGGNDGSARGMSHEKDLVRSAAVMRRILPDPGYRATEIERLLRPVRRRCQPVVDRDAEKPMSGEIGRDVL